MKRKTTAPFTPVSQQHVYFGATVSIPINELHTTWESAGTLVPRSWHCMARTARTSDSCVYINSLLLGARGARTLQPAPTPPSSSSFTKEIFTITSPLYRMLPTRLKCTQLPGSLWSLCSEQTWANKPAILGDGLALSLSWYWPLLGAS